MKKFIGLAAVVVFLLGLIVNLNLSEQKITLNQKQVKARDSDCRAVGRYCGGKLANTCQKEDAARKCDGEESCNDSGCE